MQISKPPHTYYALSCVDNQTYSKYASVYASCKCWGMRGIFAFVGGTGLFGVVKELSQGIVVQYGKRRLATVVVTGASYVCAPAIAVITNSTRVVKACKVVYTTCGYAIEAFEDTSHLPFLPLDFAIFGQPVPANEDGRFSSWSNITDIIDNLPAIGDS